MFSMSTIGEVASLIRLNRGVVALTGAGISVDSGIPDFRSADGLWARFDPEEYATIQAFVGNPAKVWNLFMELSSLENAKPNAGHRALGEMESLGYLSHVITQNIDGLHSTAGNSNVIELHGSTRELHCISCGRTFPRAGFTRETYGFPPKCPDCRGLIKPAVTLFGEALPDGALERARDAATGCKILLTVGTSGMVSPANVFPRLAKQCGAAVVEVNLEPTLLTNSVTDYFLEGSSTEILPALAKALR
jgi:NAD-dependent deacetylase